MQLIIDEERYRGLRLTSAVAVNLAWRKDQRSRLRDLAEVLRDKYHVQKALDFFHAHAVDEEHGKVGERVIMSRPRPRKLKPTSG